MCGRGGEDRPCGGAKEEFAPPPLVRPLWRLQQVLAELRDQGPSQWVGRWVGGGGKGQGSSREPSSRVAWDVGSQGSGSGLGLLLSRFGS